jgi:hypothetical protein
MKTIQTDVKLGITLSTDPHIAKESGIGRSSFLDSGILILLSVLSLLAIAISLRILLPKFSTKQLSTLRPRQKMQCRDCKFFDSNPYLQCAIHPSTVLTSTAIDCADYSDRTK